LDDEVVETELLVRVDRPGELVDRAANAPAHILAWIASVRISDLHADRPSQRGRVPALSLQRRVQLGQPPVEQLVRQPEPGSVPGVCVARGQPEHAPTLRRHKDRDRPVGWRAQHRVADLVVGAGQRHALPAQQRADDADGLLEPADAVVGRVAERLVLRVVPARPKPKDEPAAADRVGGRGHLRQQRRVPS